jgi:hypothetical protein
MEAVDTEVKLPAPEPMTAESGKTTDVIAPSLGKRSRAHQALMDVAHDCVGNLTDGQACELGKAGARHSQETMGHLVRAHRHLVEAGAMCDGAGRGGGRVRESRFEPRKSVLRDDLAKTLSEERAEKAALLASLADILPRLDQLARRVEDIARTPLPPATIAKGVASVSKHRDNGSVEGAISQEELAAAFSRMSKEDQTLTLIKASYAHPIHPAGLATAAARREG